MSKLTKEDKLLLDQFSDNYKTRVDFIIYGNATLLSLVPIWFYWRIQEIDIVRNAILFGITILGCVFLISMAYNNCKTSLVDRIGLKRTVSISKQVKEDKKLNKKEQEDFIRYKSKEVANYESTTFANGQKNQPDGKLNIARLYEHVNFPDAPHSTLPAFGEGTRSFFPSSRERISHRTSMSDMSNVDWECDVVNFVSSTHHPGLAKRSSLLQHQFSNPATFTNKPPFKKTHRRIASAMPAVTINDQLHLPSNGFSTQSLNPKKGHSRNISDPTACDLFPMEFDTKLPSPLREKEHVADSVDEPPVAPEHRCLIPCLQFCANPLLMTAILCSMVFFQSLVVSGYISSMIPTLERRFDLTSRQTGSAVACYESAAVISILLVSVLHIRRFNRLRIVALSSLLMSLGFALFSLPHFMSGKYRPSLSSNFTFESPSAEDCLSINLGFGVVTADYTMALPIFCLSLFIAGLGASPIYVLVPTYLWDNLTKEKYYIYSALFSCFAALGPASGFALGYAFQMVYIDTPSSVPTLSLNDSLPSVLGERSEVELSLQRGDKHWLGAWWLGMLVNASLIFLTALPALGFPKALASAPPVEDIDSKVSLPLIPDAYVQGASDLSTDANNNPGKESKKLFWRKRFPKSNSPTEKDTFERISLNKQHQNGINNYSHRDAPAEETCDHVSIDYRDTNSSRCGAFISKTKSELTQISN
ncbi:hypothetical protein Ciccas_008911 [Cichlidogyrus casuarinus]|uniref:Uncharacterized protein n=1 Tax=Cichlidogyrus casuarinus TaxID=1844966 RepID=A0ABD2PYJ6_9PLAT